MTYARHGLSAAALLFVVCSCDSAIEPSVASVEVEPAKGFIVGEGGRSWFKAVARDADGAFVPGEIEWSVDRPAVAAITSTGVATGHASGVTTVTAALEGVRGTANLEVYVRPRIDEYEPGRSYFGRRDYVVYVPGELPVILSAPHDGPIKASEITDRSYGVTRNDGHTLELTHAMQDAFRQLTGQAPHVVIMRLHRSKLDANREIREAAQGNPYAELAWAEFQDWIGTARSIVAADFGAGLYLDIHGHAHDIARVELGYLLASSELNRPDTALDSSAVAARSSIREIARASPLRFSRLLRGPTSLGGLYEAEGIPVIPGPTAPGPGGAPYFNGGHNTLLHGSRAAGEVISGVQLEHHYAGLRDTAANRRAYALKAARAIRAFMLEHYGFFEAKEGGERRRRGS